MTPPEGIKAVLFDLGNTLMYARHPHWGPFLARADQAIGQKLAELGLPLDATHFGGEFRKRLEQYYAQRDIHMQETSTMLALQELLAEKGLEYIPEPIVRAGLDALYAVTQENWTLEEDARDCLATLQARGYRLGMISNAGDNKDVFQLVDKFGIEPYFDFILTSAAIGVRKPHPQIFAVALAHWGFAPSQAAMVGDRLEADVAGANQAGIFSIWIRRRAGNQHIGANQPQAQVERLDEIPALLGQETGPG